MIKLEIYVKTKNEIEKIVITSRSLYAFQRMLPADLPLPSTTDTYLLADATALEQIGCFGVE